MKITPLDIQQQQFKLSFRGFNIHEVDNFLNLVAQEYEELIRENGRLKDEFRKREQELSGYRGQEENIKSALLSIQTITESVKTNARKEAELIIADAKLQAKKILSDARAEMEDLTRKCAEMRAQRMQIEAAIRSVIQSHLNLLETESRQEEAAVSASPAAREKVR